MRWESVQAIDVKFSEDLSHKKSLKLVNFWQSFEKYKGGRFFGPQCRTGCVVIFVCFSQAVWYRRCCSCLRRSRYSGNFDCSILFLFNMLQIWLITLTLSPPIPLRLYALPYWSNPPVLISGIRALWRSELSARAPECQKLKLVG